MSKLSELLLKHEGCKLKPYKDTRGITTIGIGRSLDTHGITQDEALYLLENDIKDVKEQLVKKFRWFNDLDDVRKDVLTNIAFNIGVSGFSKFSMTIEFLSQHDYTQAAIELLDSVWAEQVGSRAKELAKMMHEGRYL